VARENTYLAQIQYLRAFAALAVVAYHAADRAGLEFRVGAAGVDVFFVISGFIMWTVTDQRPTTPGHFAWNRIARVVPFYWLVTLLMAGTAIVAPSIFPNLNPSLRRLLLSLFFVPHADDAGHIFPLLVPGWTLNYEMFFYAVFSLVLALPRSLHFSAISAAFLALVAVGFATAPTDPLAVTYTNPLLLEFLAGIWLARAWRRGLFSSRSAAAALLALGCTAYATMELMGIYNEEWRILLWGLPATFIVAGTASLNSQRLARSPMAGVLRVLGDASYSIYLTHPLLVRLAGRILGSVPAHGFIAACLVFSSLVGAITYVLLERPLTNFLKSAWSRSRARPQEASTSSL
jgi:exopolysaccharide production protein ExoZ